MNFFLNVKWRRLHHEIGPVLLVLAPPDELRIANFVAFPCLGQLFICSGVSRSVAPSKPSAGPGPDRGAGFPFGQRVFA